MAAAMGLLIVAALPFATGCSQKAEEVSAEELAEQMEADRRGREAAKLIVGKEWPDTMQLQMAILDARAQSSEYEIDGKDKCKAIFDSTFVSTIRTVRPDLARQLGY